jgi:hypothetical protein
MTRPTIRRLIRPFLSRPSSTLAPVPSSSPSLSSYIPTLDLPSTSHLPSSPHRHINHPTRLFPSLPASSWPTLLDDNSPAVKEQVLATATGLSRDELRGLWKNTVVLKRVVNMTKKGKMCVWPGGGRKGNIQTDFLSRSNPDPFHPLLVINPKPLTPPAPPTSFAPSAQAIILRPPSSRIPHTRPRRNRPGKRRYRARSDRWWVWER